MKVGIISVKAIVLGSVLGLLKTPKKACAASLADGLIDPDLQPKFVEIAPNALDPKFLYKDFGPVPPKKRNYKITAKEAKQRTGLVDSFGKKLETRVFGYGQNTISWPGQTVQVMSESAGGTKETVVQWLNKLGTNHILTSRAGQSVIDTSLHWAYSLEGYKDISIKKDGVPMVPHLHGGLSDFQFDGNPEFFFSRVSPTGVRGPQWDDFLGGFTNTFRYDNRVPAGNLWYHDHALGITRLNVYAGLAGFYFVRDEHDTGLPENPLGLPAFPYELAYAIQDRMFKVDGALFYPAFPDDPGYDDFITEELPEAVFGPDRGPTALAEFFGDHIVVNGKIWPKTDVEPRKYRLRLLNGCDSRFLVVQFVVVELTETDPADTVKPPLAFLVIGSDQGLGPAQETDTLVMPTGSRYDIIIDFSSEFLADRRVIMKNLGGDAPFKGLDKVEQVYNMTDRIMAFDVVKAFNEDRDEANVDTAKLEEFGPDTFEDDEVDRTRKVALFEGTDEFGRLQPLLGTVGEALDFDGETPIDWPETPVYQDAGLSGPIEGTIAWHSPTTERVELGDVEEWEIWNVSADAHPVHLHLVHFQVVGRYEINFDDNGIKGIYLEEQPTVQHNSMVTNSMVTGLGIGFKIAGNLTAGIGAPVNPNADLTTYPRYIENGRSDVVTALPEQVTMIRAKFDKPGRYVWHCHILSHEDHEMMRVLEVAADPTTPVA